MSACPVGQVSVLREELTRRCRELENCRLESSRQLQEQQSCLEQSTGALSKELDALRTELQFKVSGRTPARARVLLSVFSRFNRIHRGVMHAYIGECLKCVI